MQKRARALVVSLVAGAVAAGCGGNSDDKASPSTVASTGPSTTISTPPTSDPRTAAELAGDKAEAERVVLRLDDFPAGAWTGTPRTTSERPEQEAARAQFGECLGVDPAIIAGGSDGQATAESDDFTDEQNNQVSNSVTLVASRERALQQLAAFQKPEAPTCLEAYLDTAIRGGASNAQGVVFGTPLVESLGVPGVATASVAYRATVPVTAEGRTDDSLLDIVVGLKGRAVVRTTFVGVGTPMPSDLEAGLTNTIVERAPET